MAFLKKIGKQANTLVETTKINSSINGEKTTINKIYTQIGEKVYQAYEKEGKANNDLLDFCDQIKQANDKIVELQEKLLEISGKKICISCQKEIEVDVQFCPHCGGKQD
ncbi:MAG: zinc-ribbon domain-containing protein [Clostridiales bacterium]|nr:zinc-ribbon domain-containing protein [Clostridiales bacterium]